MIADALPISDAQLVMLARAFALNTFHAGELSTHQVELIAELAERFVIMGRAMEVSTLEATELSAALANLEAAFDDAAPPARQIVQRVPA